MVVAIILGTRPEIIKMSPIIRECERKDLDYFVIHSGQHYSYEMDKLIFDQLEINKPRYNLNVGSGSHAEQTSRIMIGVEKILENESPNVVLVQGDTNTVLAGALAASKLHIKVGHVEAGLRSHDKQMPEEINRILVDHISDFLFAPTEIAKGNLLAEGILGKSIFVTGNTIVDATYQNLEIAKRKVHMIGELGLQRKKFILVTIHRQENVDIKYKLANIINSLRLIRNQTSLPIIFPVHPRTKKRINEFGLDMNGMRLIDPVGYLEFLQLEYNANIILTDSGGIQEEACILMVPCVTLRDTTERPETLEIGSNILAGTQPYDIMQKAVFMLNKEGLWNNPFGNGDAAKKIISKLADL